MRFLTIIFLALISVLMLCNCGGKDKLTKEKVDPFNAAVVDFLNKKSMDMKVVEFMSVDTKENESTCIVKMQDINGLYSIKPKWKFIFIKKDGKWVVESYKIL